MAHPYHGATVVHHIPGRLRVRLPRASRRPDILRDLEGFISKLGGVRQVEINPVTGSILVHYKPETAEQIQSLLASAGGSFEQPPELTDVDEIADKLEKEAEFLAAHSELAAQLVRAAKALDSVVREVTGNFLDLKVVLPAGLAIWAFFNLGVEASTPLWVTLTLFSINSFITLHRPTTVHVSQHYTGLPQPA